MNEPVRPAASTTASPTGAGLRPGWAIELPTEISRWLRIDADGMVTVFTGKVEVGQNIRTSLAQAVADELRIPLTGIQLVMGDTDRAPFDPGTFGSMTTPIMAAHLRRIAAAARTGVRARGGALGCAVRRDRHGRGHGYPCRHVPRARPRRADRWGAAQWGDS